MSTSPYIVQLDEYIHRPISLVGNLGHQLGQLHQAGLPLVKSFCITTQAAKVFLYQHGLKTEIETYLSQVNILDVSRLKQISQKIRQKIIESRFPSEVALEIAREYAVYKQPVVELMLSSRVKNSSQALSFYNTEHPNLTKGDANLIESIKRIYADLFSPELLIYYYRNNQLFDLHQHAILVFLLPEIVASGVATSIDRVHLDKQLITIEANWGLPHDLLQGNITPDFYQVNKFKWQINQKHITTQLQERKLASSSKLTKVSRKKAQLQKLSDTEIIQLSKIVSKVQQQTFFPQNVIWIKTPQDLQIIQADNFDSSTKTAPKKTNILQTSQIEPLTSGIPASAGLVTGPVQVIKKESDLKLVKPGDIVLLTGPTNVTNLFTKQIKGVLDMQGGQTSHVSVLSREAGVPAIVGLQGEYNQLKHLSYVTINGSTGKVYSGDVGKIPQTVDHSNSLRDELQTSTKVYVSLSNAPKSIDFSSNLIEGVAVVDSRSILNKFELTPEDILKQHKTRYIHELHQQLKSLCEQLGKRKVLFSLLEHGKYFTQGYGVEWLLTHPQWLEIEMEAFTSVQSKSGNLELVIPFWRYHQHIRELDAKLTQVSPFLSHRPKYWLSLKNLASVDELAGIDRDKVLGTLVYMDELLAAQQGYNSRAGDLKANLRVQQTSALKFIQDIFNQLQQAKYKTIVVSEKADLLTFLANDIVTYGFDAVACSYPQLNSTKLALHTAEHSAV